MTNLLRAIRNIVENPITDLITQYSWSNRVNNMGDALEIYIKDVFSGVTAGTNNIERDRLYSECFSYLANKTNPPDFILKNSDWIEVKKIESPNSDLALNSSYPKDKLHRDDTRITGECKLCDGGSWSEKDMMYVIWVANSEENRIKSLFFVYWDCYAAERAIYERVATKISEWLLEIPDIEFSETNELGKAKKIDPLWITGLRIRGMWHIENPMRVFSDFVPPTLTSNQLTVNALVLKDKYDSFPEGDKIALESLAWEHLKINDIEIRSPNNPANLLQAKLICYAQ
jgi:hypothetical protein